MGRWGGGRGGGGQYRWISGIGKMDTIIPFDPPIWIIFLLHCVAYTISITVCNTIAILLLSLLILLLLLCADQNVCGQHLINQGVTINTNHTATIEFEGTGPNAATVLTDYRCSVDRTEPMDCEYCGPLGPIKVSWLEVLYCNLYCKAYIFGNF